MNWLSDSINQIVLVAATLILLITIYVVGFYFKKMKEAKADGELTDHEWDGIREFKNNIPIGWLLSFIVLIFWGVWYIFFGFPLNSFSQIGQYNEEKKAYNERFEKEWSGLSQSDKISMGEGIFLVQCSQCHGINAEGIDGKAQNLRRWGKEEGIIDVINHGSVGLNYMAGEMSAGLVATQEEAKQVAAYVMKTFSPDKATKYTESDVEAGKIVYDNVCSTCHGVSGKGDGQGIEGFAPDLTTYGSHDFVKRVLDGGKKGFIGQMPSFNYVNFNDVQIDALAAYIHSLRAQD